MNLEGVLLEATSYLRYEGHGKVQTRVFQNIERLDEKFSLRHKEYWDNLTANIAMEKKGTKRIFAERNIFPEIENESMLVDGNGNGITRIINNFLNKSNYNESLVREKLLSKLNEIMGEDATFTEIVTQQVKISDKTNWEIFLREDKKGRIPLSSSGSGLKTILMVLVYTILIPETEKRSLSDYIFMFEELENNLHPSLQRRLLKYVEQLTKQGAIFFLTTHSNVLLDNFQNSDEVNILHVQRENDEIKLLNASGHIQKSHILNDLGIKASDLLQSNGIIWVEGPSDRIYINKWINLWSNGNLKEGKDYQCVFYGGRLLSNLTVVEADDLINLIKVNRNAVILIDSDKKSAQSKINETKKRINEEAKDIGVMCWITKGREIENYLPQDVIKRCFDVKSSEAVFNQFDNIEGYIENLKKGKGKDFLKNKIGFAHHALAQASLDELKSSYDLNDRMNQLLETIYLWNKH